MPARWNTCSIRYNGKPSAYLLVITVAIVAALATLPGSVASAATIATVMTSKYADGLPLYRMEQVFHRAGIQIGRGTMGHWLIGASQRHLQRLYDAMHHVLLTQPLIHGDETTLQVLHEAG